MGLPLRIANSGAIWPLFPKKCRNRFLSLCCVDCCIFSFPRALEKKSQPILGNVIFPESCLFRKIDAKIDSIAPGFDETRHFSFLALAQGLLKRSRRAKVAVECASLQPTVRRAEAWRGPAEAWQGRPRPPPGLAWKGRSSAADG